ncbi:MAG: hypothetical protein IT233_05210 [Bacteroidia bacterium]|nr:hypothetical protein [Bacteroidia bacterium]
MRNTLIALLFYLPALTQAQADSIAKDSLFADTVMNKDAVYHRPGVWNEKLPLVLGGYAEGNTLYAGTDGVTEGLQFQMRRFTLYTYSRLGRSLRFAAEVEFEDGAKEINLESAFLDLEFIPWLNFRGGVIVNPIGAFNQNHDGPKWDFIDRPICATELVPSTWSNAGFGLHGNFTAGKSRVTYEIYITNGFNDEIISNKKNRTWLGASKDSPNRFEENNNGMPLTSVRCAVKHPLRGETGISWMGGVYNTFRKDGLTVDDRRRMDVFSLDHTLSTNKGTRLLIEYVWVAVDIPETYTQQYGEKQHGYYLEFTQRIFNRPFLQFEKSCFHAGFRYEGADYNVGTFRETGGTIGDNIMRITPVVSWRPTPETVLRFNYYFQSEEDILLNPPSRTGAFLFGFSTYF